jgi:hypothetical protein
MSLLTTCDEQAVIDALRVDDRVWFAGERIGYTVQARDAR